MTLSLNETETLCRKAARGAGFSWGLAEEAGRAVRWLEERGLLGARALAGLLAATDGADRVALTPVPGDIWAARQPLCPIAAGAALSDHAHLLDQGPITLGATRYPLLLLPFLPDGDIRWTGDLGAAEVAEVTCTAQGGTVTAPDHSRCSLAAPILTELTGFAHRTYAPATEASRLAGAGAGLTDND